MTALRAHHRGGPEVLDRRAGTGSGARRRRGAGRGPRRGHHLRRADVGGDLDRDGVDRTPIIPSHEVSGVVAAVGAGVTDFAVGDEVYGLIRFDRDGAAAEYVAVPAADLATRPTTVLARRVSAALPLAGLTAWQALVDHAKVQPGETGSGPRRRRRGRRADRPARPRPRRRRHRPRPQRRRRADARAWVPTT